MKTVRLGLLLHIPGSEEKGNCVLFIFIFYAYECFDYIYIYVCVLCAWCPWRSEKGVGSLRTIVRDGCETHCGCWEMNPSPL